MKHLIGFVLGLLLACSSQMAFAGVNTNVCDDVVTGSGAYAISQHAIDSSATVSDPWGENCIYPSTTGSPSYLFIFLGASGSFPSNYQRITNNAVGLSSGGVASIGLAYVDRPPGGTTIDATCSATGMAGLGKNDPHCYDSVRADQWDGSGFATYGTTYMSIGTYMTTDDTLTTRLLTLLTWLSSNKAAEGWGNFLTGGGAVDWSKIRIGGLSQGSGLAGYTAMRESVDRACMLGGPADWNYAPRINVPASWLNSTFATSTSKLAGLDNKQDTTTVPYMARIVPDWGAMSIVGTEFDVDYSGYTIGNTPTSIATPPTAPPTPTSRWLVTNVLAAGSGYHTSPAADSTTPMVSGVPYFRDVWGYACSN